MVQSAAGAKRRMSTEKQQQQPLRRQ
jgi:hypothetical protein